MTKVTATGGGSTSIHIFETNREACNFVDWLMQYNSDLELKVEDENNEKESITECPTFI